MMDFFSFHIGINDEDEDLHYLLFFYFLPVNQFVSGTPKVISRGRMAWFAGIVFLFYFVSCYLSFCALSLGDYVPLPLRIIQTFLSLFLISFFL